MHYFGKGNNTGFPGATLGKVTKEALLDLLGNLRSQWFKPETTFLRLFFAANPVEGRHIPALLLRERKKNLGTRCPFSLKLAYEKQTFGQDFFAFAYIEGIKEGS